jgi:hypothetical protein
MLQGGLNMEKRRSSRKPLDLLKADLVHNGNKYSGVIEDICDHGMKVISASGNGVTSFIPESVFELKFQLPSDSKTCLHCQVRWVHINKTPIHGLTYRMGMEVLKCTPEYRDELGKL